MFSCKILNRSFVLNLRVRDSPSITWWCDIYVVNSSLQLQRHETIIKLQIHNCVLFFFCSLKSLPHGVYPLLKRYAWHKILGEVYELVNNFVTLPNSTEYCSKMSGIFQIFHCNWNIVGRVLLNIAKHFIVTLRFQLSEIFLKTNKYSIFLEIL